MMRRAWLVIVLAAPLLASPPARAPAMSPPPRAVDVDADPLLGPWPVERQLSPAGAVRTGSPASVLLRPAVERFDRAWASLRSLADRAEPAWRAVERALRAAPPPAQGAVFMDRRFDDLFRPRAAAAAPPGIPVDVADVFLKLTAIAFVGALILVPAGCARATAALYAPLD
jgi:hypothetical protein